MQAYCKQIGRDPDSEILSLNVIDSQISIKMQAEVFRDARGIWMPLQFKGFQCPKPQYSTEKSKPL